MYPGSLVFKNIAHRSHSTDLKSYLINLHLFNCSRCNFSCSLCIFLFSSFLSLSIFPVSFCPSLAEPPTETAFVSITSLAGQKFTKRKTIPHPQSKILCKYVSGYDVELMLGPTLTQRLSVRNTPVCVK